MLRQTRRAASVLACAISCAACGSNGPGHARVDLAITHLAVVDVETGRLALDQTVLIRGAQIVDVVASSDLRVFRETRVVDGTSHYAIPGLWDMHTHALWDPIVRTTFLPSFIANGITGIRDMGGTLDVLQLVRGEVSDGTLLAPRILAAGPILDGPHPVDPSISIPIDTPEAARRAVDSLAHAGVDFIKIYTLLPREAFFAVVEQAKKHGLPVVGHVPAEVTAVEAADAGMRSVEHMRSETGGFCTSETHADCKPVFEAFRRNQTWQTPTLAVRRARAYIDDPALVTDDRLRYVPAVLRTIWESNRSRVLEKRPTEYFQQIKSQHEEERWLAAALHRERVPLLAGSDAGADFSFPGFTLHDELRLLHEVGIPPLEILRAATLDAARFLEISDSNGSVTPGKVADLVLLSANPLDDIGNTSKIWAVVANGRFLDRAALDRLLDGAAHQAQAVPSPMPSADGVRDPAAVSDTTRGPL